MSLIQLFMLVLQGLSTTVSLMLCSLTIGFVLALAMTTCVYFRPPVITRIVQFLLFFIRGTPLLVQIFLIYYGASQFVWIRESFLWLLLKDPFGCAVLALSINTACYTTVLLEGAIHSVPLNEVAACDALGMTKWLAFRRIVLPRALRIAMPAYSNEVIMILKGTSLASTITLLDLMGVTQQLIAETYNTITLYVVVGIIYLLLNSVISACFRLVAMRLDVPR